MTDSTTVKLNEIEWQDISDVLLRIEKSLQITFTDTDFKQVKTYGDICDTIFSHLEFGDSHECTTQSAFYKIREAISLVLSISKTEISPATKLEELFPKNTRRRKIKEIENKVGIHFNMLSMKSGLSLFIIIGVIVSLVCFFVNWMLAIGGLVFFYIFTWIARKFNNEIRLKTVGDLTKQLVSDHYLFFTKEKKTVNKNEVQQLIDYSFIQEFDIDKSELYYEASLGLG